MSAETKWKRTQQSLNYKKIIKFLELNNKDGLEIIEDADEYVSYNINGFGIDIYKNGKEFALIGEEGDFYNSCSLSYHELVGVLLHYGIINRAYKEVWNVDLDKAKDE